MPRTHKKRFFTGLFAVWLLSTLLCLSFMAASFFYLQSGSSGTLPAINTDKTQPSPVTQIASVTLPATAWVFDIEHSEYLLTASSQKGMNVNWDAASYFSLQPSENNFTAQLIRRGVSPAPVNVGYSVSFAAFLNGGNASSSQIHSAKQNSFLTALSEPPHFSSGALTVSAYSADGKLSPYPPALLTAYNNSTIIAETYIVIPVSTEVSCRNCHGGAWKNPEQGGISPETAVSILATHDKRNNSNLLETARQGIPVNCITCHNENVSNMNISAAIHGFHAGMQLEGAAACNSCHPAGDSSKTNLFRDFHASWGLDCTSCHGDLKTHAASLLLYEAEKGQPKAKVRLAAMTAGNKNFSDLTPRKPGENLPHCFGCHDHKTRPDPGTASAVGKWTKNRHERFSSSTDTTGTIYCSSCHGAVHALYPAHNPAGDERDNYIPLQYQKTAAPLGKDGNCAVCHTVMMDFFIHHDLPDQ